MVFRRFSSMDRALNSNRSGLDLDTSRDVRVGSMVIYGSISKLISIGAPGVEAYKRLGLSNSVNGALARNACRCSSVAGCEYLEKSARTVSSVSSSWFCEVCCGNVRKQVDALRQIDSRGVIRDLRIVGLLKAIRRIVRSSH